MKHEDAIKNLFQILSQLEKSTLWLKRSYNICKDIGIKIEYFDNEWDSFEALCSRYARVSDILIHKVFRAIDVVELESGGTMIDIVNRAHKRKLFEFIDDIRNIKDVRNEIVHEYIQNELIAIFHDVIQFTPKLFDVINNVTIYCEKYRI